MAPSGTAMAGHEVDRQAKIREMAARIRAQARNGDAYAPEVGRRTDQRDDPRRLAELMAALEPKVTSAEDEADKVSILAAPLSMETSEDTRFVQTSAIRDTERAVKAALSTLNLAMREVERRLAEAEGFGPVARSSAKESIAKLTQRLQAAQAKVEEHRNVRRDHEQALAAEKVFGDLASRLASVEVDCERAAMMAEPLARVLYSEPESISDAEIREAREALRLAQAALAPAATLIAGKMSGLKGSVRKRMQELQERAGACRSILSRAQGTVDEAQSRAATVPILAQAAERLERVEEVMQEMREAEAPFLMGIEVMPAEESGSVLQRMDRSAAAAQAELADAHKFVALKIVEVGRLAESAAATARRDLERVKQQIDAGLEKVRLFSEESARRRRQNLVVLVKERVEEAEATIVRLKEAGAELATLDATSIPEALERALAVELEAQNLVTLARRELQERTQELKLFEGASQDARKHHGEVLGLKVRISHLEAELGKFRKLAKTFEERIKVRRSLTDTSGLLQGAEAEVERLVELASAWPAEAPPPAEAGEAVAAVQAKLGSATAQVEVKLQTAQGMELKELRAIFARLQRAQCKLDTIKETAKQRLQAASAKILEAAKAAVAKAEVAVSAAVVGAASSQDATAEKLEELSRQAVDGLAFVAVAQRELAKGLIEQLPLESKVEFSRLQLRCKALARKGRGAGARLASSFERAALDAEHAVLDALRLAAARPDGDGFDAGALFDRLAKGGAEPSAAQLCDFVAQAAPHVAPNRARVAYRRLAASGLQRGRLAATLADFRRVVRDIVLTDAFEVESAKSICRLAPGELLEALSPPKDDAGLGLQRVRCRVVRDGVCGWVTVSSAGGAAYVERCARPRLWCALPAALRSDAGEQQLQPGDVLELLQGPAEERMGSDARVRGVACHEEAVGWLQVRDRSGAPLAKLRPHIYRCNEPVAMTDVADFAACRMVRRLDAGEALELVVDAAAVNPAEGGERRKFRACRDSREGWVTTRGSQGTSYVRPAPRHYVCTRPAPMHAGLGVDSEVMRVLQPGEAFGALEEPRDVSGGGCVATYRVRTVRGGAEGLVTATAAREVQPWSSRFVVEEAVPLTTALSTNEAVEPFEVLRVLQPGELLELPEPPLEDLTSGSLRARCVAAADAAAGWATVREAGGELRLRPATAEEAERQAVPAPAPDAPAER